MCGGTALATATAALWAGLSPRVRGNHLPDVDALDDCGSIPACAGEPFATPSPTPATPVYPRVCGGTVARALALPLLLGLSPRVRGNPPCSRWCGAYPRSIPACAGEPRRVCQVCQACKVYPRVCGGTVTRSGCPGFLKGLSPRVRGNPGAVPVGTGPARSIPACAGEPRLEQGGGELVQVYPRVCGGTPGWITSGAGRPGLSPRVRGNPAAVGQAAEHRGSIPACAGEPRAGAEPPLAGEVYPRVCGGTFVRQSEGRTAVGLSPRVRGNRRAAHLVIPHRRSIPACAGEPRPA